MRARQLRPSFDSLTPRITPSDLTTLAGPIVPAPVDTMTVNNTPIVLDLGPWLVTGTPQNPPCNVLQPNIDPTTWTYSQ